jgi:hypothetical protein
MPSGVIGSGGGSCGSTTSSSPPTTAAVRTWLVALETRTCTPAQWPIQAVRAGRPARRAAGTTRAGDVQVPGVAMTGGRVTRHLTRHRWRSSAATVSAACCASMNARPDAEPSLCTYMCQKATCASRRGDGLCRRPERAPGKMLSLYRASTVPPHFAGCALALGRSGRSTGAWDAHRIHTGPYGTWHMELIVIATALALSMGLGLAGAHEMLSIVFCLMGRSIAQPGVRHE